MKVRIISSAVGIAVFFAALFSPQYVFDILAVALSALATFELYKATGILKTKPLALSGVFGPVLCALFGLAHKSGNASLYESGLLVTVLYIGVLFVMMITIYKKVNSKMAAGAFACAFLPSLLYSYVFPLREGEYGIYLVILLFAATWCADGGAYFAGVLFGKHKLSPVLSPKKTVEGAIGGIIGSVLAMLIYAAVLYAKNIPASEGALILTGVLCSVLGPVGDIATSAIKREHNIKDYGNLIPGQGGALDRFDSVLLTAPLVFFINELIGIIG